jgi:hypothetical protein
MFSFVTVSHPSCAVFWCFALYLASVLSVFVYVFPYWVHPFVMLLTFAASAFRVGVHSIGYAFRAPQQTLTLFPEREVEKNFPTGFFGCVLFGHLTSPLRLSFGRGVNVGPWGVKFRENVFNNGMFSKTCFFSVHIISMYSLFWGENKKCQKK